MGRPGSGSTILVTFWIVLGSWVAVFPDTLEPLFGVAYGFKATWGVPRVKFEAFTLGTLGVIVLIALIGYSFAGEVRAQQAEVPLELDVGVIAPA